MSLIVPPPAAPADTRNVTQIAVFNSVVGLLKSLIPFAIKLFNAVWGEPGITPQQAMANLGTGGVSAFTGYAALCAFIATESANVGVDWSLVDPAKSGVIALPALPAGWGYSSSDGQTVALVPPAAAVPTGLTAAAETVLPGKVNLAWTPAVGGLSYSIQRSEDNGATFQEVAIVRAKVTGGGQIVITPAAAWRDEDILSAGTQYRISATTPAGTSAYCPTVIL